MALIQVLMRNIGKTVTVNPPDPTPTPVNKSGNITTNETWSGLIHLTGDVNIQTGVQVTISPGTQVISQGDFAINGQGQLQAIGNASQRITFTNNTSISPTWYGVTCGGLGQVQPDVSAIFQFAFCDFSNGSKQTVRGGNTNDYTFSRGGGLCAWLCSSFSVDNCTFTNCKSFTSGGGLYINGGGLIKTYSISNCTFTNCSSATSIGGGFKADHGAGYNLTNLSFSNCQANSSEWNNLEATANTSTEFISVGKQHFMVDGFTVKFVAGTPPSPLSLNTEYFVISSSPSNSNFQLANTLAEANSDTPINLTSVGSSPRVALFDNWMIFDGGNITVN